MTDAKSSLRLRSVLPAGLILIASAATVGAQNADPLLDMVPGARTTALGRAATALAGEPEAIVFNPALAGPAGWLQVAHLAAGSVADVSSSAISFGAAALGGAFALGLGYDDYGDLVQTGTDGEVDLGTLSLHDLVLSLTYARPIVTGLSVGATLRRVESDRGVGRASGTAVDLGALLRTDGSLPLAAGVSLRNLGGGLSYRTSSDDETAAREPMVSSFTIDLPTRLRVGGVGGPFTLLAGRPEVRALLTADLEVDVRGAEGLEPFAGVEVTVGEVLSLRAGALSQVNPFAEGPRRDWGYSAGIGVASKGWVVGVAREMGLNALSDQTHVSAGYRF